LIGRHCTFKMVACPTRQETPNRRRHPQSCALCAVRTPSTRREMVLS
jgi:hypothetical protein